METYLNDNIHSSEKPGLACNFTCDFLLDSPVYRVPFESGLGFASVQMYILWTIPQ
jgi:hypothetical protein